MSALNRQSIRFSNGNNATVVCLDAESKANAIVEALSIGTPKAIVLVIGGAGDLDEAQVPRLTQLYSRGVAKAVLETEALVVSGGTQAGVMSLIGQGIASRGKPATLLGVAPASLVSYPGTENTTGAPLEPHHTHFVLTEGKEWGDETATLFSLVKQLGASATADKERVPTVAIVAGGGEITVAETLRVVRQNIPLLVIEGSGGFADGLAVLLKDKNADVNDPALAEILADGELHAYPLTASVAGLERLVIRELGTDSVLLQSWETFAAYDLNAAVQQRRFDRIQLSMIGLGVLGTLLVVVQQIWAPRDANHTIVDPSGVWRVVHHSLILIPILLTALVTAASRFKQGNKWLLLRAGAEAIKREIYRYRTRSGGYETTPEQLLAKRVEDITRRTMRTEVNLSALQPYDKNKGFPPAMGSEQNADDGFSRLTPDRYVTLRLNEQIKFYTRKTVFHEKRLRRILWGTYVAGGLGTYLAAINWQAWVALTTAVVAALGTYLGYRQTEHTLMKYNQTATDLANVKAWWDSLSAEEQAQQANINSLVDHTERVLQSELDGWIQQMQNALAELRKGQEATAAQRRELEESATAATTQVTTQKVVVVSKQKKEETVVAEVAQTTVAQTTVAQAAPDGPIQEEEEAPVPEEEFMEEDPEALVAKKRADEKLFQ